MPIDIGRQVAAVVVTYNPDLGNLRRLIETVKPQVSRLFIVDNGSSADIGSWLAEEPGEVVFVALGENHGIARAQNAGIEKARVCHSNYVLLLDQDSIPAADMVSTLLAAAEARIAAGIKLACVGPRYKDARQDNPPPFIRVNGFRLERQTCAAPDSIVAVDYLIASGSLIPLTTLDVVGGMQDELFIDYVDIEWGLRAQQKGYSSFGVCAAHMQHDLGDNPVRFRGRNIPVHSPLRHYYHFRNAVWLYRQPWLRFNWKVVDASRLLRKFVFYSLFTVPRLRHAKMMTIGIAHGLFGVMGKKSGND